MSLKLKLTDLRQCHSCHHCQQIFKSSLHLKHHKHRIHNRRKPYVCPQCTLSFQSLCELQEHERKHGDRTMVCAVCDTLFHTRRSLQGHMRIHVHHEGNHECGYCGASYLSIADARLHVLTVHGDAAVLPPTRLRKKFDRHPDRLEDEIFCVEQTEGLKIRLKRTVVEDTSPHITAVEDNSSGRNSSLNTYTTYSDDEEQKVNLLLRGATFVPRNEPSSARASRSTPDSGLLVKPKLELGSGTSWSGSKFQPRLNSSDFLSKTIFHAKPQQTDFGQPSNVSSLVPRSSTLGLFGQNTVTNTFPNTGFSPANGCVFKTPTLFSNPITSSFGASSQTFSSATSTTLFHQPPKFGRQNILQNSSVFGHGFGSLSNGYLAPKPLNNGQEFKHPSNSPNASNLNGIVKREAVFGSKEHARSMVLTNEDKVNPFEKYAGDDDSDMDPFAAAMKSAKNPQPRLGSEISDDFTQSETSVSEVCSEIEMEDDAPLPMQPAPIPESSMEVFKQTTELPAPALAIPEEAVVAPESTFIEPEIPATPRALHVVPEEFLPPPTPYIPEPELCFIPEPIPASLLDLPPPTPYLPTDDIEPITQPPSPVYTPPSPPSTRKSVRTRPPSPVYTPPSPPSTRKSARTPRSRYSAKKFEPYESPRVNGDLPHLSPKVKSPERIPSPCEPVKAPESPVKKRGPGRPRKNTKKSVSNDVEYPAKNHISQPTLNGDASRSEVTGHIDLETPSISISIPKAMVSDPYVPRAAPVAGRRTRTQSGSRTPARTPSRTPARTPSRTPARTPSRTPSRTPLHAHNYEPLTPAIPEISDEPEPPHKIVSRKRMAPTKGEMMLRAETKRPKIEKKKPLIGPRSYLKTQNRVVSESEPESELEVDSLSFTREEITSASAGRTESAAAQLSSFKENSLFLSYLRRRALDLIIVLFPDLRVGGHFSDDCDDVDGLLDYLIGTLNGHDGPSRVLHSGKSQRENLSVALTHSAKSELRHLRGKICKLLKTCFPLLTLDFVTKSSIDTLPKLLHKIIKENS